MRIAAVIALLLVCSKLTLAAEQPARATDDRSNADGAAAAESADLGTRQPGADWPAFLGPSGDSKSPERGILTEWPASGPRIVWQRALGTGYGMPSISRGRLFMFDRVGREARLVCLHSETGKLLWEHTYATDYVDSYGFSNGPRCCPVIDGDRVYIYGVEGKLLCLRVTDGKELWLVDVNAGFGVVQNFFGVGATPVIDGDLLIAQVGGSPPESQRAAARQLDKVVGNGSGVVAFNKLTGEVVYQISDELASYASPTLATIDGRRWCFVFARGGLLGFNPTDGSVDFHYPWRARILESVNASNPVVVGDQVFISETYGPGSSMLSVRPDEHTVVWRDDAKQREKAMQTHWSTPIYHDGYLYGDSGRHSGSADLRCIHWQTGEVKWSEKRLGHCSLTYVDGHLLCLSEFGTLRLLRVNPEKYDLVAETRFGTERLDGQPPLLKYPAWAAPILSHGLLYVRGSDRLLCLELIPPAVPEKGS